MDAMESSLGTTPTRLDHDPANDRANFGSIVYD